MNGHTVEKIGGTSMSRTQEVLDNILMGKRKEQELYNRIFVVSAYGGITDMLLEHKKSGASGVYALYAGAESDWAWGDLLNKVGERMCEINMEIFEDDLSCQKADQFVRERIEGVRSCLIDLHRLCSYGHFQLDEHLITVREMLAAIGEAHSAFNTALLLQQHGVNAHFIDLTGWRELDNLTLEERIQQAFNSLDLARELPIVTGYPRCKEGTMMIYDRGYSEITFSKIAVLTEAREAIIHKEYHLSSADPKVVDKDRVEPIGRTNYDVADQLSNLGMEAIHPKAAKGLRQCHIPLRVKNAFDPDHAGTLIDGDYKSDTPCVEIIAGRKGVFAIEFFEQDMVGSSGYDTQLLALLERFKLKIVAKDTNANTITHFVASSLKAIKRVTHAMEDAFPSAAVAVRKVALVSAIGSNMQVPGLLSNAVSALAKADINILALHQSMRQVDMQFVVDEKDYEEAIIHLHEHLIESYSLPAPRSVGAA
ncbi:Aspartate/glutamate/uridylate kinase [Nitrosococcus oceani ATCC 19707]|uniref:aspartate kinase n=2 Tax=Nitrosococcus oceani TaxID=1229 RepID=Q3JCA9_NITOC|nr:aspartate kinase [Nitrosococcus oceani]ABA57537.1 Aspartate/glutamate/uridylate kinase [Nitrosococcus oceani ATCC 19707]EDZ68013.1 ACT domain protein [Nitrosococcus oceani AFC27]KFI20037.1 aspartate kinase [Nitrosococcus oceani C-27]GEM20674.1 aspartate kinase [Nitrosococcus oceani]